MTDWITTDQVNAAAKRGEISALECSLEHHRQGRDADWVELRDAIESQRFHISPCLCACCQLDHQNCEECPLGDHWCHEDIWMTTDSAWKSLKKDYSNANFKAFQEAESKVCDYIEAVLEKKRAEEKSECDKCKHFSEIRNTACSGCIGKPRKNFEPKEPTPALRHGDYGYYESGCSWVVLERNNILEVFGGNQGSGMPAEEIESCLVKLGNIFDDLKRNSEDLTRTSVDGFVLETISDRINIGGRRFLIDQAIEFHQKLGQLIVTAKRKT